MRPVEGEEADEGAGAAARDPRYERFHRTGHLGQAPSHGLATVRGETWCVTRQKRGTVRSCTSLVLREKERERERERRGGGFMDKQ